MGDTVLIEKRGQVALLTLNRPDRANTLNGELIADLQARAGEAALDHDVRVLVVTGAGRHFCGGADLRADRGGGARPVPGAPSAGIALDWVQKPVIGRSTARPWAAAARSRSRAISGSLLQRPRSA